MNAYATALIIAVITVASMFFLMRSRRIREKYAAVWVVLALCVVIFGAFPGILSGAADMLGVETPVNLLFLASTVVLLVVSVQYSVEISRLEESARTLTEETAILRADLEQLEARLLGPTSSEREPDSSASS